MAYSIWAVVLAVLVISAVPCYGWTQEELDLFDLVEEVGIDVNFYHLMDIEQDATSADIKRAYRQLSLQLHPDKSDDPDAAEKFRKMVAVAKVLKDDVKREMYDRVLVEGLPDWQQPLYYYRRMRKMGLLELTILLLVMASAAHYIYGWAVFAEKQLLLQNVLDKKLKKDLKKSRGGKTQLSRQRLEAECELLTAQARASVPQVKNLLPIILAKGFVRLLLLCWSMLSHKLERVEATPPDDVPRGKEEEVDPKPLKQARNRNSLRNGRSWKEREEGNELGQTCQEESGDKKEGEFGDKKETHEDDGATSAHPEKQVLDVKQAVREESSHTADTAFSATEHARHRNKVFEKKRNAKFSRIHAAGREDNLMEEVVEEDSCSMKIHVQSDNSSKLAGQKEGQGAERSASNFQSGLLKRTAQGSTMHSSQRRVKMDGLKSDCRQAKALSLNSGDTGSDGTSKMRVAKFETSTCAKSNIENTPENHQDTSPGGRPPVAAGNRSGSLSAGVPTGDSPNSTKGSSYSTVNGLVEAQEDASTWSQFQQTQLEWALTRYPKFSTDRWLNVAKAVPGKSEVECIERCKQLYEELKLKKLAQSHKS